MYECIIYYTAVSSSLRRGTLFGDNVDVKICIMLYPLYYILGTRTYAIK